MKKSATSPLTSDHLDLRPVPLTAERAVTLAEAANQTVTEEDRDRAQADTDGID